MKVDRNIPCLVKTKTSSQLYVRGKPFLMLAGELQNSSLSNARYMNTVWQEIKDGGFNTVLGGVTWEMVEPVEGQFDFAELDKVIADAHSHDIHLVLLWFGAFKNAMGSYVPGWVKRNISRFPRVKISDETNGLKTIELPSPFCSASWEADAKAFAALMRHIKEFDKHQTVIMVQVENETGLLEDSRDRSEIANAEFVKPIPKEHLVQLQSDFENLSPTFRHRAYSLKTMTAGKSTWNDVFGEGTAADEMFMAWGISRYVEHVAKAGKVEYPLPFYTNAWLNLDQPEMVDPNLRSLVAAGGTTPGKYPSGGPCPHTMDVWRFNAPSLDFFSPDIYAHDYEVVCQQYRHRNQPLFIPEQRRDEFGARRVWLAYASYSAIGCSPFGIDTLKAAENPYKRHYELLGSISDIILDTQANKPENMMGFFFDAPTEGESTRTWVRVFGEIEITIARAWVIGKADAGSGMVIYQGNGKFLLVGWGFQVSFKSTNPKSVYTGLLHFEEKEIGSQGELLTGRILNGDETKSGATAIMPNSNPDYGDDAIVAITIPARTMIAECIAYSVEE